MDHYAEQLSLSGIALGVLLPSESMDYASPGDYRFSMALTYKLM